MATRSRAVVEAVESRRLFAAAIALTSNNALVEFDTNTPGTLTRGVEITGLQPGESLLSIDVRPATGQFYGVGSTSRLYTLDRQSGAATQVGTGTFSIPLDGTATSIDFNPFADALRVVTTGRQDLRVNVNTGAVVDANLTTSGVQPDGTLTYATGDSGNGTTPQIAAAAYSANFSGTAATTLYGVDAGRDVLVTQGSPSGAPTSPNGGTLLTVGALGADFTGPLAMDVAPGARGDTAVLIGRASGATARQLHTVDLTTGRATFFGNLGVNRDVVGLAILPPQTNVLALSTSNRLIRFDASNPNAAASSIRVRLPEGETLLAIDFQPRTGDLIGLSGEGRLYRINPANGRVTALGGPLRDDDYNQPALDFNPQVNAIRVTNSLGTNLRVNATTGALIQADADLAPAAGQTFGVAPTVAAVAYNNNVDLAASTTLYGIDTANNALVTVGSTAAAGVSPNTGQLFNVGPLGFRIGNIAGLDIASRNGANAAVGIFTPVGGTARAGLYDVNLLTGRTARIGTLPRGVYSDVAIVPDGVALT